MLDVDVQAHAAIRWTPSRKTLARWPYRARATVSVVGVIAVAVGILALAVTGLVGFPFGVASRYAGFRFTPGLAIGLAFVGVLLIRLPVGSAPRPGRSIADIGAERTPD